MLFETLVMLCSIPLGFYLIKILLDILFPNVGSGGLALIPVWVVGGLVSGLLIGFYSIEHFPEIHVNVTFG